VNELRRKVIALLGGSLERETLADVLIAFILSEAGRLGGRPRKHLYISEQEDPKPVSDTDGKPASGGEGGGTVLSLLTESDRSGPSSQISGKCERDERLPAGFAEFWRVYPRKKAKGRAVRAWQRQRPPLKEVLEALAWQTKSSDWTKDGGEYVPYPEKWLNGRQWTDERPAPPPRKLNGGSLW
jgi:hypothetical protein